jgi:hypothetical protein
VSDAAKPKVNFTVHECLDQAQIALQVADANLQTITELLNLNKARVSFADLIANAEARTRLGIAWADLAMWKNTVGEVDGA